MKGVFYEKKYFFKILILISLIFYNQTVFSKDFDIGLSISGWGTGLEGNYFYQDEIHFGTSYQTISRDIDSSGSTVSVKGELSFSTFEFYSRYYFRSHELPIISFHGSIVF